MTKEELLAAQTRYRSIVAIAKTAARVGDYRQAIKLAKSSWPYVVDAMTYERRYEERTFSSVPCIDLVLDLAPLLFDTHSLDEVETLLKASRSIDRHATDDLAERVGVAREMMSDLYNLWKKIEVRQPVGRLSKAQEGALQFWSRTGLIEWVQQDGASVPRRADPTARRVHGVCTRCGRSRQGVAVEFYELSQCHACAAVVTHIIEEN